MNGPEEKPGEKFLQLLRHKVNGGGAAASASSSAISPGLGNVEVMNNSSAPLSFPLTKSSTGKEVTNEVLFIEALIVTYFDITRRQMSDFFPKVIMHHLFECSVNGKFKDAIVSV